jgi:hypothetical protein
VLARDHCTFLKKSEGIWAKRACAGESIERSLPSDAQWALPAISFCDGIILLLRAALSGACVHGHCHVRNPDLFLAHVRKEFDGCSELLGIDRYGSGRSIAKVCERRTRFTEPAAPRHGSPFMFSIWGQCGGVRAGVTNHVGNA